MDREADLNVMEVPTGTPPLMGYLPENAPAYTDMTVHGFLSFAAEIRGLRGEAKKKALNRVVELCFLIISRNFFD
jgi:ABC-2 type transport system ATP-binding protein